MEQTNYAQLRAYAAQYGTIVGLMWIASFAFFIVGLVRPLIGNVSLFVGLASIFVAGYLVRKFNREVAAVRFRQAWWMSIQVFMYASLLMAAGQFVYFRFIDNGLLIDTYSEILQRPQAIHMIQDMMPDEDPDAFRERIVTLLQQITPIQFTFEFLIYNFLLGFFLSIPIAWFGIRGRSSGTNHSN